MHNLFLVYFVNLYMFRAYLGPSVVLVVSNQDNIHHSSSSLSYGRSKASSKASSPHSAI